VEIGLGHEGHLLRPFLFQSFPKVSILLKEVLTRKKLVLHEVGDRNAQVRLSLENLLEHVARFLIKLCRRLELNLALHNLLLNEHWV